MTLCAYFLLPNGRHWHQVSMGGLPPVHRQPVTHPSVRERVDVNPAATHLEFHRTELFAVTSRTPVPDRVYVFTRAVRLAGPMGDERSWVTVPLTREGAPDVRDHAAAAVGG